ncbi:restriction endonuclease subunit S [Xanthomonas campestris]|uniref:restriction endonuclease subunit S n=1 Tax=Xanthomonas campestris TaxID=339 RepID=UPI001F1E68AD|nr:restriction endonuclease subunit S [Xanthomonas campestris]WHO90043.1 restriction endonuclease subunit S [Xanthomonas campestris]
MIFPCEKQELRLKWLFESCKNGAWGSEPDGEADVICIRAADFDGQSGRLNEGERTLRAIDPAVFEKIALRPGDLVMEKSGGGEKQLVGRTVLFDDERPSVTSNFLARCRPAAGIDPAYLNYLMLAIYAERGTYPHIKQSTGIQNLDLTSYLDVRVSAPELLAQQRIARFLDEKTALIDALIEKKQALLAQLAEKRQALITRAVTKGLNTDVPMKPSGVDWLGYVPRHWEVKTLRRHVQRIEQGWSPQTERRMAEPDEWGVLKSGCVNLGIYDENEQKALPGTLDPKPELEVRANDVLMCRASGSMQYIGSVALVERTRTKLMFSDKTYRISLSSANTDREYFVRMMSAKHLREQIRLSVSGAEGLANNIPQSNVLEYLHAFPPLLEQVQIADFLRESIGDLDEAEGKIRASSESWRAYRLALVTAAVTGQLPELNG